MRFLFGVVVGIILGQVGVMRIALGLQHIIDIIKSWV